MRVHKFVGRGTPRLIHTYIYIYHSRARARQRIIFRFLLRTASRVRAGARAAKSSGTDIVYIRRGQSVVLGRIEKRVVGTWTFYIL